MMESFPRVAEVCALFPLPPSEACTRAMGVVELGGESSTAVTAARERKE